MMGRTHSNDSAEPEAKGKNTEYSGTTNIYQVHKRQGRKAKSWEVFTKLQALQLMVGNLKFVQKATEGLCRVLTSTIACQMAGGWVELREAAREAARLE